MSGMEAMADDYDVPWYKASLEAFSERTQTSPKVAERVVAMANDIGLSSCESCVSIGVGIGDADIPLLANSFNNLSHYIAVEPNSDELVVFKDRLNRLNRSNVMVDVVNKRVEDWEGPRDPLDAVLVIHVLYHIEDKLALFKRCLDWLKPGGILLIAHAGNQNCFFQIGKEFDVADTMYFGKDVRADLNAVGVHYQEAEVLADFDIRDRDRDIMKFLLQRDATNKELDLLDQYLHEIMPTGKEEHTSWIFWSKKQALGCQQIVLE